MEYVKSVKVSGGCHSRALNHSITFDHPHPRYSTNALRLLDVQDDFPALSACEYIQLNFELPIQIQQVYVTGSSEMLAIFSHNDETDCICEPLKLTKITTTVATTSHTPSNSFYFFFSSTDTNPLLLNIDLDIHQSTLNQILLTQYVTNNTAETFTKITKESNQEHCNAIEKITLDAKKAIGQIMQENHVEHRKEMEKITTLLHQQQLQSLENFMKHVLEQRLFKEEETKRQDTQRLRNTSTWTCIALVFAFIVAGIIKMVQW